MSDDWINEGLKKLLDQGEVEPVIGERGEQRWRLTAKGRERAEAMMRESPRAREFVALVAAVAAKKPEGE